MWVTDGTLFDSVAEGGLGVWPDLFRISGYLTDGGRTPAAEYQAQLAVEGAADAREEAAAIAAQQKDVRALQAEVWSLSSSLAAVQLQGGQGQCLLSAAHERLPFAARIVAAGQAADAEAAEGTAQAAAQELEAGEPGGSKSSSKSSKRSSRRSQASEARSSIRAELAKGGVPSSAVDTLARLSVTLAVLKGFSVEWAVGCLAEKGVTLNTRETQQLAAVTARGGARQQQRAADHMQTSSQKWSEQGQPVPATWERPEPKPVTTNCDCLLSYNGAPNQACSTNCRDTHPCSVTAGQSHPHHDIPDEVPVGRVAERMPSNKQALADALVAMPGVGGSATRFKN